MIFIYSKPHFNPTVPIYHQCYYALFLTLPQKQLCLTVTVGPKARSAPSTHVIGSSSRPKGLCGGLRRRCASGPWFHGPTALVSMGISTNNCESHMIYPTKMAITSYPTIAWNGGAKKSNSPDVILEGSGPCPCVPKVCLKNVP